MTFSEIFNIIMGGGLVVALLQVITLKAAVRKANAEAAQAQAEAKKAEAEAEKAKVEVESMRITNTENATRILMENIVKPLKEELDALREGQRLTKIEILHFRKAIERSSDCPYSKGCPVTRELFASKKTPDGTDKDNLRKDGVRNKSDP